MTKLILSSIGIVCVLSAVAVSASAQQATVARSLIGQGYTYASMLGGAFVMQKGTSLYFCVMAGNPRPDEVKGAAASIANAQCAEAK